MTAPHRDTHDWVHDAACKGADPDVFYPPITENYYHLTSRAGDPYAPARAICADCTVRVQCLDDALTDSYANQHGFWGGRTPNERRHLIRRQRRGLARTG